MTIKDQQENPERRVDAHLATVIDTVLKLNCEHGTEAVRVFLLGTVGVPADVVERVLSSDGRRRPIR